MRKSKIKKFLKVVIIIALVSLVYSLIEPFCIKEVTTQISSNEIPKSFKGTRIVFITDIHHSKVYSRGRIKNLVDRVNKLNPDIILLGGDYVTKSSQYIAPCFDELANLKAPLGKYGVLGNHDHWEGAELTRASMKKAGIECLDNRSKWIVKNGERIKLGGVGDYWEDQQITENTISDTSENDFVILLSHNPDYVENLNTNKLDLVLSGHTHGGQASLFGLWSPFTPSRFGNKYRTGLIQTKYTKLLVSNGIGYVGYYPIRFFARPQINIIELN